MPYGKKLCRKVLFFHYSCPFTLFELGKYAINVFIGHSFHLLGRHPINIGYLTQDKCHVRALIAFPPEWDWSKIRRIGLEDYTIQRNLAQHAGKRGFPICKHATYAKRKTIERKQLASFLDISAKAMEHAGKSTPTPFLHNCKQFWLCRA